VVVCLQEADSFSLTTIGSILLTATQRAKSSQISICAPFCHDRKEFLNYATAVVAYSFGLRDVVFPIHRLD
jgi:hypothetical protein